MTCEEIRAHIENGDQTAEVEFWSDSRVTSHVAACAECNQFVQERQSIRKSLQLLRESVGSVPGSLDAAVLADYRRAVAERRAKPKKHQWKAYVPLSLRWGAVAALLLIATTIALYSTRKPHKTIAVPPAQPASPTAAVITQTQASPPPIRPVRHAVAPVRKHSASPGMHPATRTVASIPGDFRGLIYCDELSCNGAMDVIRVQLPSSVLARPTSAFRPISGSVNADVLIGPDGIARGIRIEEREF